MKKTFEAKQVHGTILCRDLFKVEEPNISIRKSHLEPPINYGQDDDSGVLSGGSMLEGCHSTTGEPQSVNPPHYVWWCWDCLVIVWWADEVPHVFNHIQIGTSAWPIQNFHDFLAQQVFGIRSARRGSIVHEDGWSCSRRRGVAQPECPGVT